MTASEKIIKINLVTRASDEFSSFDMARFYHSLCLKLIERYSLDELTQIIEFERLRIRSEQL